MIARFSSPLIYPLLKGVSASLTVGLIILNNLSETVDAQIVPTEGTISTLNGNQFDITGGQRSADGANLFHSFTQFGLNQDQIANFLSNPSIQNILARVNGNNPSLINGLIQVTGGNSNLFLINPSGILFGNNASLNVPASFTATTAAGIGFGNNWLGVAATDYSALNGLPDAFAFPFTTSGAIVNTGNLSVPSGNLILLGGTVLSTGTLSAQNGQVIAATIPGQNLVRLGSSDSPLSLEIAPPISFTSSPVAILPKLLTGGTSTNATGLTLNQNGQVELTGSGLGVENGDVAVRTINAKTATLSANRNLTLFESQLQTTGNLNLFANNTVQVRDGIVNPVLVRSQSNLFIQGNQSIDILALNHLAQTPFVSGGNLTLVSDGNISGDAHFASGGNFTLRNLAGGAGTFISLYDPIISANGDVTFGDYSGVSLKIEATGSITGGDINITGPDTALTGSDPDIAILSDRPSVILRAGVSTLANPVSGFPVATGGTNFNDDSLSSPASVSVGNITTGSFISFAPVDTVIITAPGDITTGTINTSATASLDVTGGGVNLNAGGSIFTGAIDTSAVSLSAPDVALAGHVTLVANAGNITFDSINTRSTSSAENGQGGNVKLFADNGTVRGFGFTSYSPTDTIYTQSDEPATGFIEIRHDGGIFNDPFVVGDVTINGTAGAITADTTISPTTPFRTVGSEVQGNITFTFNNDEPILIANSTLPSANPGQSITFTTADLSPFVIDPNRDTTAIFLTLPPGATLTIDGVPVQGPTVQIFADPRSSQVFEYTPPAGATGTFPAFTLIATDAVSNSAPVTVQASVTSTIDSPIDPDTSPVDPDTPPEDDPKPTIDEEAFEPEDDHSLDEDPTPVSQGIVEVDPFVSGVDESVSDSFEDYLDLDEVKPKELPDVRSDLSNVESNTGIKPALVYALFVPNQTSLNGKDRSQEEKESDQLELFIVTAKGNPIRKRVPGATRGAVVKLAQEFQKEVSDRKKVRTTTYLASAQQLYQWLVAPLEAEFKSQKIQSLVFITDAGLRSLPFAALHDGTGFLIERYSLGLMPSISLTDTRYSDIRKSEVLAMGASQFKQTDQDPLPSVPQEITTVSNLWKGKGFLNDGFTLQNLKSQRSRNPYGIIHLATHAEFQPGALTNSYIQLSDTKLQLDQIRQLGWNNPPVELLVLSACRTALGNEDAELGFAGLAVKSGVKTAMASLWYVDDQGSLELMSNFYQALKTSPIKAEALRQAQLQLLKGNSTTNPQSSEGDKPFAHPYYWSSFTMIGSPW
jgi:filamentous hemagglutinin family protein